MSKVRVGINGFGRIGRLLLRAGHKRVTFVGINDLSSIESMAHLLKFDSTQGKFSADVQGAEDGLHIDGETIPVSRERDPEKIPWKDWGADIVLECTGVFKAREDFQKHIFAGAKRVLVSAPAAVDATLVFGVNHETLAPERHVVVSNASCTTNCLAPVAKVIHDTFGIERGLMTTIHSYTNDQRILDAGHKDLRRARAGALSMIPTTTGAAKAVGEVLPELRGRLDGMSVRVPTPDVSLIDLVVMIKSPTTKEDVNTALTTASEGPLKGILGVENKPLVSVDYIGDARSSIVDLDSTMVSERLVKVVAWYDNEMGFSNRMIDMSCFLAEKCLS